MGNKLTDVIDSFPSFFPSFEVLEVEGREGGCEESANDSPRRRVCFAPPSKRRQTHLLAPIPMSSSQ